jgi:hypothetical protein
MDTQKLLAMMGSLSGHLAADIPEQEGEISRLQQMLARSLFSGDARELKGSSFSHEGADLFRAANIPPGRAEALRAAIEANSATDAGPEFRVFVREVPVRSTQLHGSTPLWAFGSAIEQTLGPFRHADGRSFWFDFIRIEKLITLYVQGFPDPALLFKISRSRFIDGLLHPSDERTSYDLSDGSVWINSRLLAADAPAGFFTGLSVEDGMVTLSDPPQTVNGKLTAAATTKIRVQLRLRQPDVIGADDASPYGEDARAAELRLPEGFTFRFVGMAGRIEEVGSSGWNVFGQEASFELDARRAPHYDEQTHRVLAPLNCSERQFEVNDSRSPFHTLSGSAEIRDSAWALTAAPIDVANPTPAAGTGALLIRCRRGLSSTWRNLDGGEFRLNDPHVLAEPGRVSVTDPKASGSHAHQDFRLWIDEQNTHGTSVTINYPQETPYYFFTLADGNELLAALGNADFRVDRPVTVRGEPPPVRSKNSLLILALSQSRRVIYLFDDNIVLDNLDAKKPELPKPLAFALKNALFKVTPANGCLLFGRLSEDMAKVERGWLYLTFGMYAYLPTLPDPYAANLGSLSRQFRGGFGDRLNASAFGREGLPWLWLVAQVKWAGTGRPDADDVRVSFHFAPLQNQFQSAQAGDPFSRAGSDATAASIFEGANLDAVHLGLALVGCAASPFPPPEPPPGPPLDATGAVLVGVEPTELRDYVHLWGDRVRAMEAESFALLDVSTKADLLGISFGANIFGDRCLVMVRTHDAVGGRDGRQDDEREDDAPADEARAAVADDVPGLPLQVVGLNVVSRAANVRTFTVPQISWEPVFNLTPPGPPDEDPPIVPRPPRTPGDPAEGFNYYPNDGGPTRIVNNGADRVALAPIPVTNYLVRSFEDERFFALAAFGLPFGLKALALLASKYTGGRKGTRVSFDRKSFAEPNCSAGARRLKVEAGAPQISGQGDMFMGSSAQLNNILDINGNPTGNSTLAGDPTDIYNQDFFDLGAVAERGVPLTRVDLSGYGASIFSNWRNPKAPIASVSQARFDVMLGRCAHEIIQVISIVYPYGAVFVRTITLFRASTNYVYRVDSGWKAISHGLFDFTHYAYKPPDTVELPSPYEIHPGVIGGVFNIRNIKETGSVVPYVGAMTIPEKTKYVDGGYLKETKAGETVVQKFKLRPVYFDADVEVKDAVSGFTQATVEGAVRKLVPSKRILGFVQISPLGQPLTPAALAALVARQGTIGGPLDCVVNIAESGQQKRLIGFDFANSLGEDGKRLVFAVPARGNVGLPKDGSWSMVRHEHKTGDVSPVPRELSVPLIRIGKVVRVGDKVQLDKAPETQLTRIADPLELLRAPTPGAFNTPGTVSYGFLHSTDTQKALFLNPSFKHNTKTLLSKTPPLFADAFRIVNSKGIFPNAGDAITNFGSVFSLARVGNEFDKVTVNGQQLFSLMDIGKVEGEQGYKLRKKPGVVFQLPPTEFELIKVGTFRIYIEYEAKNFKPKVGAVTSAAGALDFDVDSFAGDVASRWKSHMGNVSIVVDLGPIPRLMTIKGNWDAKKGAEANYSGSADATQVPTPQIEFAGVLDPAIQILQILEELQGGNYAGAFGRGVRLAMSNKAGSWEYKFEASKEIPVVRFPPTAALYNNPTTPLKLEAGIKLGAYFNAALKVPTSDNLLLPTAGGYIGFYGRLSVMCLTIGAATVYAIGQVNLDIGADTKLGPTLHMKFGFGAQIVVGLPVVANVSVLYMVGVEIFLNAVGIEVSAFMLFQGHADILGGIVGVTITIEAKGTVRRELGSGRTDLAAQVTFAIDISIFLIIDISFSTSWEESRQIA